MKRWPGRNLVLLAVLAFLLTSAAFAQEGGGDLSWLTVLFTWSPVLLIVGLWIFFMRRIGMGKKGAGSYQDYMRVSQEKMEQIEASGEHRQEPR